MNESVTRFPRSKQERILHVEGYMQHENTRPRSNTAGKQIVPKQKVGNSSGAAHKVLCSDRSAAISLFQKAKARLLDVNNWHEYGGEAGAHFELRDARGNKEEAARIGSFIRIDLPGPGPRAGKGFDWVIIEDMKSETDDTVDEEWFAFRVRPCPEPGSDQSRSAHFYTRAATSTFIVKRTGKHITAAEAGRNEIANSRLGNWFDRIRNTFVGWSASNGFAYPQWKKLMEGILD